MAGSVETGVPVPRVLLSRTEAAGALGMSLSHFQRHVQPKLACVYVGQLRLFRVSDLETWAADCARLDERSTEAA